MNTESGRENIGERVADETTASGTKVYKYTQDGEKIEYTLKRDEQGKATFERVLEDGGIERLSAPENKFYLA